MPAGTVPRVSVLAADYEDIPLAALGINYQVMPAQEPVSKSTKPSDIKFSWNRSAYAINDFNQTELAVVSRSGTMRGVGIGVLEIAPIHYNPAAGILRVYHTVKVRVSFNSTAGVAGTSASDNFSPYFQGVLKSLIYMPTGSALAPQRTGYSDLAHCPVTYLIVAADTLAGSAKLAEFVEFKRSFGFNVEVHYVADSDSPAAIDAWIEARYAALSPKPSFVLLVGDESGPYTVQSVVNPPLGANEKVTRSDLIYGVIGDVAADNHIPSMYVGRFSVRSQADLAAQVDKTIWYERGQFAVATPDLDYLERPLGAAGADDTFAIPNGNPHIAYEFNHYLNAAHGMPAAVHYLHPEAGTKDIEIRNLISAGVAFYNYTAHGSETSFADPSFSVFQVHSLTNSGRYPIVIGNCCLTGSFGTDECFGESWLNTPNGGAVAYIGATMSTYWDPDLVMGVGTVSARNDQNPPLSQNTPGMLDGLMMGTYPTVAAMKHVGLLAVENYGGRYVNSYWLSYHLFGDPSLMPFLGIPPVQQAAHLPVIPAGANVWSVTTAPGAYVAVMDENDLLHGAAVADTNGLANIMITPFAAGAAHLAVSAQFQQPYFETVPVAAISNAYVVLDSSTPYNCIYGATGTVDIALVNAGIMTASNTVITASTHNPYATVSGLLSEFGNIASGSTSTVASAVVLSISNSVPDREQIQVDLEICWGDPLRTNFTSFAVEAAAPAIRISSLLSGTSPVAPGEARDITYTVSNVGHASASNLRLAINQLSSFPVTLSNTNLSAVELGAGGAVQLVCHAAFGDTIPKGSLVELQLGLQADKGVASDYRNSVNVGVSDDFEASTLGKAWRSAGDAAWGRDSSGACAGTGSAGSGRITDDQSSSLIMKASFVSAGKIIFCRKVSSEEDYDKLLFYIDDTLQASWSGEVAWGEKQYSVKAGEHLFRWTYKKDGSESEGADRGWIDNLILQGGRPIYPPLIAVAGNPLKIVLLPNTNGVKQLSIANQGGESLAYRAVLKIPGSVNYVVDDSFESGNIMNPPWTTGGAAGWQAVTDTPTDGVYCVRSGNIANSFNSDLALTVSLSSPGYLSFCRKVSSESGYDYLRFYINNELKAEWSGQRAWQKFEYFLAKGDYTLRWSYVKDGSEAEGSDCCWLDAVKVSEIMLPADAWADLDGSATLTGSVAAGQQSLIPVNFDSTELTPGIYTGSVVIVHNAAGNQTIVPLRLTVIDDTVPNRLPDPSPNSLAFGSIELGNTKTMTFRIGNSGNAPLTVTGLSCPPGFSADWSGTVAPGAQSPEISVAFTPVYASSYSGDITINCDSTGGDTALALSGSGYIAEVRHIAIDFDRDATSDLAVFRSVSQYWVARRSSDGTVLKRKWGVPGDVPATADFDGDGQTDIAVFRPSAGWWYVLKSSDAAVIRRKWGVPGDVAVPADYDGDGKADLAIFRPATQQWVALRSSDGSVLKRKWGIAGDIPVPADYDGDALADIAVFRPSTGWWYVLQSRDGSVLKRKWGIAGDIPVPGDYDGDGKADLSIFRPATQQWVIKRSSDGTVLKRKWGIAGDIPAPADYDGDAQTDLTVFRPSTGWWYILKSSNGSILRHKWGIPGDQPVQRQHWIRKSMHR
jgi:hypothetical protein